MSRFGSRFRLLQYRSCPASFLAVFLSAIVVFNAAATGVSAQSGDGRGQDAAKANAAVADSAKDGQRKADEYAEAAKAINGPAGNPECVWLGRRVVSLMWRDDLDTAFRHLDLYDRFGCTGGHVQAAFRCLTRFGAQIDPKVPDSLSSRVQACWINPNAQPQAEATIPPANSAPSGSAK